MSANTTNVIKPYQFPLPSSVTINPTDYTIGPAIPNPQPFPVTISNTSLDKFSATVNFPTNTSYIVTLSIIDGITLDVEESLTGQGMTISQPYQNATAQCELSCGAGCNGLYVKDSSVIQIIVGNISGDAGHFMVPNNLYVKGDIYEIYLNTCDVNGNRGGAVRFIRSFSGVSFEASPMSLSNLLAIDPSISSTSIKKSVCRNGSCRKIPPNQICNKVLVPGIIINGLTNVDGTDVGDVKFTITDEFTYYKEKPIPHKNHCGIFYIDQKLVKETIFHRCCPQLVSVLRGKGMTFYDKALSIYNASTDITLNFTDFLLYLILYGMARYILSRILYGNFDINYLLGEHYKKFLKDLGGSRFCGFIEIFEDCQSPVFGFNKYFKFEKRCKSSK